MRLNLRIQSLSFQWNGAITYVFCTTCDFYLSSSHGTLHRSCIYFLKSQHEHFRYLINAHRFLFNANYFFLIDRSCSSSEFQCGNGQCIHLNFYCDGIDHCDDATDEIKCGKKKLTYNDTLDIWVSKRVGDCW